MRLHEIGRTFVWSVEADVFEFIPRNRATVKYILLRSFRSGQTFVRCSVRNSNRPVLTAGYWMIVGLGQVAVWFIAGLLLAPFETPLSVVCRAKLMTAVGKLTWGRYFRYHFYSRQY